MVKTSVGAGEEPSRLTLFAMSPTVGPLRHRGHREGQGASAPFVRDDEVPAPDGRGPPEGRAVPNRTYRITEIVGTSDESVDAAIRNGISRVVQSVRHVDWFEVTEIRGNVHEGEVAHLQVGMKVGFRLEDE